MLMMPAMGRIYWLPCWSPPQLMLMMQVSCFIDLWDLWSLLQLMLMMPAMGRIYWLPCWSPPQLMLMMQVSCFIDLWDL